MGREVKRVPLNFDWPLKVTWKGLGGIESPYEPPEGPGWQMWENVSDSPISPVFKTPEKLATWLTDSKASAFAGQTATYDEWLSMIHEGSALTGVMDKETGVFRSGVSLANEKDKDSSVRNAFRSFGEEHELDRER
jgi:hypothetical protein